MSVGYVKTTMTRSANNGKWYKEIRIVDMSEWKEIHSQERGCVSYIDEEKKEFGYYFVSKLTDKKIGSDYKYDKTAADVIELCDYLVVKLEKEERPIIVPLTSKPNDDMKRVLRIYRKIENIYLAYANEEGIWYQAQWDFDGQCWEKYEV